MAARITPALIALLLLAPAPVLAQGKRPNTVPPETCTAKASPPSGMEAWSAPAPLAAALAEADLPKAALKPGQAVTVHFAPVGQVKYRVPPEKADGPATYGGLYRLTITEAGTYRVASSAAPWMDVFAPGNSTPIKTVRFGHGPACTGIGKMVEFALQPGDYLLQFSESLTADPELMVVKTGS
ncbi:MAG TPA: homogentisate 1,2-dioxygenase [Caulobacteraceae bacterium]|jgi:hypothetical protein